MAQDFTPRNYQVELMKIALKKNSIIFLPTGSGKTFIALMVLKSMSGSLLTPYSEGGKITMILVNTIALVEQHAKYIRDHTTLTVGQYTGDMNLDFWPKDKWYSEYNKYQVFIMTSQILVNLVNFNYIDLNKVNLLIFDECHRGVSDQPMRQLMKSFVNLTEPPRVIGLTATLLNGNCSPARVSQEVLQLETTYHSKVATVDGLADVVGYSTNPSEEFKICMDYEPSYTEKIVKGILEKAIAVISNIHSDPVPMSIALKGLKPLEPESGYKRLTNLITDIIIHLSTMGTYGAVQSIIAHTIQIERLRKHCQDLNFCNVLMFLLTTLQFVKELLTRHLKAVDEKDQIFTFSSDKVLKLLQIFQEYKTKSKEELCCIVFATRRFTAKVIYYILKTLSNNHPDFSHIKPNFVVGFNCNPYNDTRENLFLSKKNKQILDSFINKEINVLVASDVLEEGVDIPKCTLVIKFDKPTNYRSYIQSKGRARHKESLYYIMIEQSELSFQSKYQEFQVVEKTLNDYLIGKNLERPEPSRVDIERMYNEDEVEPYYVDGPGSAQVNMLSAIPLLCQYCNSLPSDIYTTYAPEWYMMHGEDDTVSVVIMLPVVCPILEIIQGPYMNTLKSAKRAAALRTCILLHQLGELDDHLLPKRSEVTEEDVSFLFPHYPSVKEPEAGYSKTKRLHKKQIPKCVQGQLISNQSYYLHIIDLNPMFPRHESDINTSTIYDAYTSPLCFGIITANPLPVICDFPIYVSLGTINVSLGVNQKPVILSGSEIQDIKGFHCLIFEHLLRILQQFLIFDNNPETEMLLLVPVDKQTCNIDFDLIRRYKSLKPIQELPMEEKLSLEVTQESHLKKIISPWYRVYSCHYIVSEVCLNKNAFSPFPNEDYGSFKEYFNDKHNQSILNPNLPLLLVKGLTTRLNFVKPKAREGKRRHEKLYEEMSEYLIPELVVKQEFPSSLWIQASFLPTILSRISYCLQLEELRAKIARETGLGQEIVPNPTPLQLDEYLLSYKPYKGDEENVTAVPYDLNLENQLVSLPCTSSHINKDFAAKKLEAQYPWKDIEEPKDIERELDATLMDIEYYEKFISCRVDNTGFLMKNESPSRKTKQLALTYHKDFVPRSIKLLDDSPFYKGPELCVMYQALTTAKASEIVNLERLETLGDSFLKLISSVYITMRFPTYDEGRATSLKGRLVSNKNLYYLAVKRNLSGILKYNELSPKEEWLPPCFTIPKEMQARIENKELSVNALFNLRIPYEEQVAGVLSQETLDEINREEDPPDSNDDCAYSSMAQFFKCQYVGDKYVADVVESLLGAYIQNSGVVGGIKFVEWIGIIPKSERLEQLLTNPPANPILDRNAKPQMIDYHLPCWKQIEQILDYKFNNRAYLLQALTHSSYTPNRITLSYEKLEFLGDAILDFLITCHIFESSGNLNPGQLTDLRSALVNNNTFASFAVRCNLHKFLLMINSQLQRHIDNFVGILEQKNFQIDDHILILLEEDEINVAEQVDVPKVLGDILESVAGAIYLDSGKNLKEVWRVFYKIMWKEIELFSQNVPKNIIRKLFEWPGAYPKFGKTNATANNKTLIPLQFMRNGIPKLVHGCGSNRSMAKKAAAKLALQNLELKS